MPYKNFLLIATISMAIAIAFGALGAHALKNIIGEQAVESWKTGVFYQIVHSLAIFAIVFIFKQFKIDVSTVLYLMLIGMIAFSGSIYMLSLNKIWNIDIIKSISGPITPIGGLLLISSWVLLFFKLLKIK